MSDYETRLTALDRALQLADELDHDAILTTARAFEEYLVGTPDQPPAEKEPERPRYEVIERGGSYLIVDHEQRKGYPFGSDRGVPDRECEKLLAGEHVPLAGGSFYYTEPSEAPEPRPLQVGDTVLVAEGAEYEVDGDRYPATFTSLPAVAVVTAPVSALGNVTLRSLQRDGHSVHPSYLTLKEAAK